MRTRLLGTLLAFGLVAPLTLMTANTADASSSTAAIRTTFFSVPYAIFGAGNTFPIQAPGKTKIIEVTCAQRTRSNTEMILRGQVWVVAKGQTRRFKTNKLLGLLPRITKFVLRCPSEGRRTNGNLSYKK